MSQELVPYSDLQKASILADEVARQNILESYLERKSKETIRRQYWDLKIFAAYLEAGNIDVTGIVLELPKWQEEKLSLGAWEHVTYGIVQGFVRWQLTQGFAIGSINVRLSTIKTYCKLASLSGFLSQDELAKIRLVEGFRHKEGRNADESRKITRLGNKKAEAIVLEKEEAKQLKNDHPDTPQGWRDRVLMCFFLDHGLRCGELASLVRSDIDLSSGTFHVYRKKVDKHQYHTLTQSTLLALTNYLKHVQLKPNEQLLRGSQKSPDGSKMTGGMCTRAITARVNYLGKKMGIKNLSAHDGRHTWGTHAARGGTDLKSLTDAGGWSSVATPMNRYVQSNKIANEGVKLDY
jgi:integrase